MTKSIAGKISREAFYLVDRHSWEHACVGRCPVCQMRDYTFLSYLWRW